MTTPPPLPTCCTDDSFLPLSDKRPMVLVVAGVLIDNENRVLLAQRPKGKSFEGLWEFPGGKVRDQELPEEALVRELHEELGIAIAPGCLFPLTFVSHPYPSFHLLMPIYGCRVWQGDMRPQENQAIDWVPKEAWKKYAMPPADTRILPFLIDLI